MQRGTAQQSDNRGPLDGEYIVHAEAANPGVPNVRGGCDETAGETVSRDVATVYKEEHNPSQTVVIAVDQ